MWIYSNENHINYRFCQIFVRSPDLIGFCPLCVVLNKKYLNLIFLVFVGCTIGYIRELFLTRKCLFGYF